jgi:hypothetical protein
MLSFKTSDIGEELGQRAVWCSLVELTARSPIAGAQARQVVGSRIRQRQPGRPLSGNGEPTK